MAKGIITSLLRIYLRQNTKIADYEAIAILLFHRWMRRGWNRSVMKEYILHADIKVRRERCKRQQTQATTAPTIEPLNNRERLFIHWEYHPRDIPKRISRGLYDLHLRDEIEK